MHSPMYALLKTRARTPEAKRRCLELVSQLISFAAGAEEGLIKKVVESIVYPYRSTTKDRGNEVMEIMGTMGILGGMNRVVVVGAQT